MSERRVAVTGLGVVAPGGVGVSDFWSLISAGRTATRTLTFFDPSPFRSQVAAEVDLDPAAKGLGPRDVQRLDRAAQFALVAAREATTSSELADVLEHTDPGRVGVTVGSAVGASTSLEEEYRLVSNDGRLHLVDHTWASRHLYDHFVPSSFATEVAWAVGAEGPSAVISTGCTSGIDAVAHAADVIRDGGADIMVAGATDAPITPITVACFDAIRATTSYNDTPESASRPYDASRNGFVLGEGAAFVVLEELASAWRRGAHVHAEIAAHASRSNAYHMTGLRSDGYEMADAITSVLDESRMNPDDVDYVNAHGSGTVQNDRHETAAFRASLGERAARVPVSSIKSMIGHSLGAIGAIEIVASVLAIRNDVVPPTANLTSPDPELGLDYVPLEARDHPTNTVLTVGSGFGGFQSAMLLTRPELVRA